MPPAPGLTARIEAIGASILLMLASAAPLTATTIVPPRDLGELALRSDAVVLAESLRSWPIRRGPRIATIAEFRVAETLSGGLAPGAALRVLTPGGEIDGEAWLVAGSPRFEPGARYLLFLSRRSGTDEWRLPLLAYGLLAETTYGDRTLLAPVPEGRRLIPLSRPDGEKPEPVVAYFEDAVLEHLRGVLAGSETWDAAAASAPADAISEDPEPKAAPDPCTYFLVGGSTTRWRTFDSGGHATIWADSSGDPSLSGDAHRLVHEALESWMDITGCSLNLVLGGTRPSEISCGAGDDTEADMVVFNDPCSDMDDIVDCIGVYAYGGPLTSGTHFFDGSRWSTVIGWHVVVNDGLGCTGAADYRTVLTHELGHGLGFGHYDDSASMMYAFCCNSINATDRTCVRYTYPAIDPSNERPVVDAGSDRISVLVPDNRVRLSGRVVDDGLPASPGEVTTTWRKIRGPGTVTFDDAEAMETVASFSESGSYLLSLTADDGELIRSDLVELDVEVFATEVATATFRQRWNGYESARDTWLAESAPTADHGGDATLDVDGDDPSGTGQANQALLRFDDLFGPDDGQIPPGAAIRSAALELTTENAGDGATFHRMLDAWDDDASWASFGGDGIQPGGEALEAPDAQAPGGEGTVTVDVTASLAAWSTDPCSSRGWAILPVGTDGWGFRSTEELTGPRLTVRYSLVREEEIIAIGDSWRYLPGPSEPAEDWTSVDFAPGAAWGTGPSGIGYGDDDDATRVDGMRGSYLSLLCRREFDLPDPGSVSRLSLRIDYDDGFVAYLNGVEAARSPSMGEPGSPVDSGTPADSREAGAAETYDLDAALLRTGRNVLAFRVHNERVSSSDLSFLPELWASVGTTSERGEWRIFRGVVDFPPGWETPGYDDAAWESGPGGIGYGWGDDATSLDDMQGSYVAFACRRWLTLPAPASGERIRVSVIHDDGVAVYVDGTEIGRSNLPDGAITSSTRATTSVAPRIATFEIPPELLGEGPHLLAASAHTARASSTNLSFAASVVRTPASRGSVVCATSFRRGDATGDGAVDLSDAIRTLLHLFSEDAALDCPDAADANDDGAIDLTDAVTILGHLFRGTGPLPAPGGACGPDPTEDDLAPCRSRACPEI